MQDLLRLTRHIYGFWWCSSIWAWSLWCNLELTFRHIVYEGHPYAPVPVNRGILRFDHERHDSHPEQDIACQQQHSMTILTWADNNVQSGGPATWCRPRTRLQRMLWRDGLQGRRSSMGLDWRLHPLLLCIRKPSSPLDSCAALTCTCGPKWILGWLLCGLSTRCVS